MDLLEVTFGPKRPKRPKSSKKWVLEFPFGSKSSKKSQPKILVHKYALTAIKKAQKKMQSTGNFREEKFQNCSRSSGTRSGPVVINQLSLDLGNGFTKMRLPSGELIAIPSYVTECSLPTTKIIDSPLGYYVGINEKNYGVGNVADHGTDEEGTHNGLYSSVKTDYYLHFVASIFAQPMATAPSAANHSCPSDSAQPKATASPKTESDENGAIEFRSNHLIVKDLLITVPPNANVEEIVRRLVGVNRITHNGISKVISINNVNPFVENDASGFWIANKFTPSKNFLVVQCGRGTTHMGLYSPAGARIGKIKTLGGESRLIASVQRQLATPQGLLPPIDDIMKAYFSQSAKVYFNDEVFSWKEVFGPYRQAKSEMFAKMVQSGFPLSTIGGIYFVGGAANTFDQVKKLLKGIQVIVDYQEERGEEIVPIASQFIEVLGLELIGTN
ncbi:MAG: hypothetical protein F6J86_26885 [Symploca sp. SIO1B1]|nr:hypothetical protein [Symploca sp. SIO1B1]